MKKLVCALIMTVMTLVLLQGCAGPELNKSNEELLVDAEKSFSKGYYDDAIAQWKKVKESYPEPELAAKVEMSIADSYFLNKSYIEAATEYESFIKFHPKHERTGYALYRQALSNYNQITGIDRDQTPVKNALGLFEAYILQYPKGELIAEAQEKARDCRDKQLQYEIYVGKFYLKNEKYPAAIARFEKALKDFSKLPRCDEALYQLGRAYREDNQSVKAAETFERLIKEYPTSAFVKEAKKLSGN